MIVKPEAKRKKKKRLQNIVIAGFVNTQHSVGSPLLPVQRFFFFMWDFQTLTLLATLKFVFTLNRIQVCILALTVFSPFTVHIWLEIFCITRKIFLFKFQELMFFLINYSNYLSFHGVIVNHMWEQEKEALRVTSHPHLLLLCRIQDYNTEDSITWHRTLHCWAAN